MVGATGVEPARISPQDPKSCVSANSTTRPRRRKALLETEYWARAEAPNSKLQAPQKLQASNFKHPGTLLALDASLGPGCGCLELYYSRNFCKRTLPTPLPFA